MQSSITQISTARIPYLCWVIRLISKFTNSMRLNWPLHTQIGGSIKTWMRTFAYLNKSKGIKYSVVFNKLNTHMQLQNGFSQKPCSCFSQINKLACKTTPLHTLCDRKLTQIQRIPLCREHHASMHGLPKGPDLTRFTVTDKISQFKSKHG